MTGMIWLMIHEIECNKSYITVSMNIMIIKRIYISCIWNVTHIIVLYQLPIDIIARRHWHMFRTALHNKADWRMATWQRARQGELPCLHTPIPGLCNAILNTCQMPSRFYIIPSNVNRSQTHIIPRNLMEGHMHAKTRWCLSWGFVLNCVHASPAHAATALSPWKIRFMMVSGVSWNCQKVRNGMWSCDIELCTNGTEASKGWVFIIHFSIYSTSWCHCNTGTGIPRLFKSARWYILSGIEFYCSPTIHWRCDARMQNWQMNSPPALWKPLSFDCPRIIVTLNDKSSNMLLELNKNKMNQWLVIEKSVNKCHIGFSFSDI